MPSFPHVSFYSASLSPLLLFAQLLLRTKNAFRNISAGVQHWLVFLCF
jgi:hypothetical protein